MKSVGEKVLVYQTVQHTDEGSFTDEMETIAPDRAVSTHYN